VWHVGRLQQMAYPHIRRLAAGDMQMDGGWARPSPTETPPKSRNDIAIYFRSYNFPDQGILGETLVEEDGALARAACTTQ